MHCSIWVYTGDPDDLAARYEAMVSGVPVAAMRLSACARTRGGIVVFDTCPSKEVFDAWWASPATRALLERHGLDAPASIDDYPVVRAYANGARGDA